MNTHRLHLIIRFSYFVLFSTAGGSGGGMKKKRQGRGSNVCPSKYGSRDSACYGLCKDDCYSANGVECWWSRAGDGGHCDGGY